MLKSKKFWCVVMVAAIVAVDRITKVMAAGLEGNVVFIKNVISFAYTENTGAAFSMFSGARWLLSVVTAAGCVAIFIYIFTSKKVSLPLFWALGVVAAGGIGNLTDRIAFGYVIDFIRPVFINFATFNIADCAVTLGVIGVIAALLLPLFKKEKKSE